MLLAINEDTVDKYLRYRRRLEDTNIRYAKKRGKYLDEIIDVQHAIYANGEGWKIGRLVKAAWKEKPVAKYAVRDPEPDDDDYSYSSYSSSSVEDYDYHDSDGNVVATSENGTVYDTDGKPIEGGYADLNGDGTITTEDRYFYHSPTPDYMLGFSTSVRWKNLTLSTSLRANIGNYAYNATAANNGALKTMKYVDDALFNLSTSYLDTGFRTRQLLSDYYVENASFLKMDNLMLNYNFGKIKDTVGLNLSFMIQNVFTITKYSGVDPEIYLGVDQNFYPRPRIYSLGIGLTF